MSANTIAIHNALVAAVAAGSFPEAVFDEVNHPSIMSAGDPAAPASIEAGEILGAFGQDPNYRRGRQDTRLGWAWLVKVSFHTRVIPETFEQSLLSEPLVVARDEAGGIQSEIHLHLEACEYEHPPRGGASNGSRLEYRFAVDVCRR